MATFRCSILLAGILFVAGSCSCLNDREVMFSRSDDAFSAGVQEYQYFWGQAWVVNLRLNKPDLRDSPTSSLNESASPYSAEQALHDAIFPRPEDFRGSPVYWRVKSLSLTFARIPDTDVNLRWYW